MNPFVTERDIDYYEIIRRGGANGGDEDFAFLRCPHCGTIFLIDYEIDTVYSDAADLTLRINIFDLTDVYPCSGCNASLSAKQIWSALRQEEGTLLWQVPWDAFQASEWSWAARPSQ